MHGFRHEPSGQYLEWYFRWHWNSFFSRPTQHVCTS